MIVLLEFIVIVNNCTNEKLEQFIIVLWWT